MSQLSPNPESAGTANTDMKFVFDTIHELHDSALESATPETIRTLGSYMLQFQFSTPQSSEELSQAARSAKQENGVEFIRELTIASFVPPTNSEINPSDDRTAIGSQGYGDGSAEFFLKAEMSDSSRINPALKIDSTGLVLRVNYQDTERIKGDRLEMPGEPKFPTTYRMNEHDRLAAETTELLDPTNYDEYRDKIVRVFRTLRLQEARVQLVQTSTLDNLYPLDAPTKS